MGFRCKRYFCLPIKGYCTCGLTLPSSSPGCPSTCWTMDWNACNQSNRLIIRPHSECNLQAMVRSGRCQLRELPSQHAHWKTQSCQFIGFTPKCAIQRHQSPAIAYFMDIHLQIRKLQICCLEGFFLKPTCFLTVFSRSKVKQLLKTHFSIV